MMSAAGQWTRWPFCPSYFITPLLFMYLMYSLVLGSVLCINVYLYGNWNHFMCNFRWTYEYNIKKIHEPALQSHNFDFQDTKNVFRILNPAHLVSTFVCGRRVQLKISLSCGLSGWRLMGSAQMRRCWASLWSYPSLPTHFLCRHGVSQ